MDSYYKLVFKGEIAPDKDLKTVLSAFAALFKISKAKAEKYFDGKNYVLKTNLCKEKAIYMNDKILEIGVICYLNCEQDGNNADSLVLNENKIKSGPVSKERTTLSQHVTSFAGTKDITGFSIKLLLSDVFKKRNDKELEEYYSVGTIATTPNIGTITSEFPRPWLFIRLFGLMLLTYLGFVYSFEYWENLKLLPGLIFVGTFAMPLSVLVFFFETNLPRNISLIKVFKSVLQGGILSLILSLLMFQLTSDLNWLGAPVAGIAEEPGKLIALLLIANAVRYPYILNGLLFGAAVGCGFGAFESAGYAFEILLNEGYESMIDNITLRGVLSPFGHIVWTGMIGAALWKVKKGRAFNISMLFEFTFIRVFLIAVLSHMLWNSGDWMFPWLIKAPFIAIVGWIVIFSFINEGLIEINEIKLLKSKGDLPI
ncbi:PrsW family intramembrane metalloprotease [Colwellia sp. MB3u-70]|uniref:PrsW family intramembrane metalloprotease n=1 Tax=unclassified Colwellia TaxID=196834 RepID=UPI0015F4BCD6|nr:MULTISPECIES: PrsW family glutamic-type intramembrane protease [unclassified Colwellia]MBA6293769.1 PrsW family intramembrane metalloprotease [Colwellia sp. MB3u-8]MBA6306259.1 PrsW family intramembrane metalloprotease [Colwellia sp. MB3u-70]